MDVKSVHVDWLSASFILSDVTMGEMAATTEFKKFVETMPDNINAIFTHPAWEQSHGRKPYKGGYHNQTLGVFVWLGGQNNVLIEVTGKGVQTLRDADVLSDYMLFTKQRTSRIDIAVDIETDTRPVDVVAEIDTGRFKSRSSMTSQHGETEYIGSRKSERYCRVYRYNEPHPRHKLLRVEFVVKRPQCEYVIESIMQAGRSYTAQQLANTFGLGDMLKLENHNEAMPATRNDRKNSKTEAWLIRQAAPAFQRLVKEGTIEDWREWLETYFLRNIVSMDGEEQQKLF